MTRRSDRTPRLRALRAVQVLGALVIVAAVVLLGIGAHWFGGGDDATAATAVAPATRTSVAPASSPAPVDPSSAAAEQRGGARSVPAPAGAAVPVANGRQPVRISIPAIGVDSKLTDLGIAANGTIEVPGVPARAGWLDSSPAPGQRGPAVIAGHVDSTSGPAVFYRLSSLKAGDRINVTRRDGRVVRFTVDGVGAYPKRKFPTRATYGPVPGPALRLITCGGSYVKSEGGYLDNVVVFAT